MTYNLIAYCNKATASNEFRHIEENTLVQHNLLKRRINSNVQLVWAVRGQHAVLHHLNAICEYEPVNIVAEVYFLKGKHKKGAAILAAPCQFDASLTIP